MLEKFFELTAWPMEKPASYGAFHLGFFFIGLAISILLAYLLRNTTEKQNKIVLVTAGSFLILTEIYKQLFYYYVVGNGSYQWWIFPFQLCSIPMYFCVIAPFIKNQKIQKAMYNFLIAVNLMGGFIAFLEPSGLVHEYWTLTLHAFVWHMVLVFIGLYLGFTKRAATKIKEYSHAIIILLILAVCAFMINLILRDVSAGSVNMFYVGPSNSPIIVFKDISAKYGWYVNTPLYLGCIALAAFAFYAPFCYVNQKRIAKKDIEA